MMMNRRMLLAATMAAMGMRHSAFGSDPKSQGYFVPAEGSPHTRTWMCWPSDPSVYSSKRRWKARSLAEHRSYFESVQETIGRLAAAIAEHEPVTLLAEKKHHALASKLCGPKVQLLDIPTDDIWARDSGPVFLRNGKGGIAILDLNYNGWGAKTPRIQKDSRISAAIAENLACPYFKADIVGEGGAVEFDGEGTIILNESSWVNDNRNPGKTRDGIEAALKAGLGVETVIWLPGVRGGVTDDHIDGSLRIVRPGVLIMGGRIGGMSERGRARSEAKKILSKTKDARGRSFEITHIPSAVDVRSTEEYFFTGYANYYVGNGAVFTPSFGDAKADAYAVETLGRLFPERRIVSLDVDRIYENGGGIHCVTQQQPAP
jgi:agmatine deiminase